MWNPRDTNTFATASSGEERVQVRKIHSSDFITTLSGSDSAFLYTDGHPQLMVTWGKPVKESACAYVWDLQTRKPVHKLVGLDDWNSCLVCPSMPQVLTAPPLYKGLNIFLWDARTYRFAWLSQG
ncbi:hypothetical protein ACP70R_021508 [Stipagrostis hirtigluma subsp. patula]